MARKKSFEFFNKSLPWLMVLALALGLATFIFFPRPEPQPLVEEKYPAGKIFALSEVEGYNLFFVNEKIFFNFLDEFGFWQYDGWPFLDDGVLAKELRIVYTDKVQPMRQMADDKLGVILSFGVRPQQQSFDFLVYINPLFEATLEEKSDMFLESFGYFLFDTYLKSEYTEEQFLKLIFENRPKIFQLNKV